MYWVASYFYKNWSYIHKIWSYIIKKIPPSDIYMMHIVILHYNHRRYWMSLILYCLQHYNTWMDPITLSRSQTLWLFRYMYVKVGNQSICNKYWMRAHVCDRNERTINNTWIVLVLNKRSPRGSLPSTLSNFNGFKKISACWVVRDVINIQRFLNFVLAIATIILT